MKNIKQLFSNLLFDNNSVADITNAINAINKSVKGEKPVFSMIKLRNLSQCYADSFNLLTDHIDALDDVIEQTRPSNIGPDSSDGWNATVDYDDQDPFIISMLRLYSASSVPELFLHIRTLVHDHPPLQAVEYVNVGNVSGYPLALRTVWDYSSESLTYTGYCTLVIRGRNNNNYIELYEYQFNFLTRSGAKIRYSLTNIDYQRQYDLYGEIVTMNDVLARADSNSVDNTIIVELIDSATMQGDIAKETVLQVVNKYGETPFCVFVRDAISRVGTFNYISLLSIISSWFKETLGVHDGDNEYYTPMEYKNFCADFIAVALSTIVTIIGTLLTIVFSIINGALAVIFAIISTVISSFAQLTTSQAEANVIKVSMDPTYDYPIPCYLFDNYRLNGFTKELNDYGVVALTIVDDPTFSLIFGKRPNSYYRWAQFVINGGGYVLYNTPTIQLNATESTTTINLVSSDYSTSKKYDRSYANSTVDYVTASDQLMRKWIEYGFMALCLDKCSTSNIHHDYTITLPTTQVTAMFSALTEGHSEHDMILQQINMLKTDFQLSDNEAWTVFSIWLFGYTNPGTYNFIDNVESNTWSWTKISEYIEDFLNNLWLLKFASVNHSSMIIIDQTNLCVYSGIAKMDPSINYPSISRSAIVSGMIVGALTAAAIAGTAILAGRAIKNRAAIKLAKRESQFNMAKDNLISNPNDPSAKAQFAKANRKLTRAWNHAGKAGLTMYNGFDTGASATVDRGSAISEFKSYLTADSVITSDTEQIIKLIKG